MKLIISALTILSLSACGLFGGDDPSVPPVREKFHACPEYPKCAGKYKSGGICEPSGEHHSVPEKCKRIQ